MKTIPDLEVHALELIRRTSTQLPEDIRTCLLDGRKNEAEGSAAEASLDTILENVELAGKQSTPICQDTGTPVFYIDHPWDYPTAPMVEAIRIAVQEATKLSYLRPNSVDSVSGKNTGDNSGHHFPGFYFQQWDRPDEIRIRLMLKGGGSENMSAQYSLPHGGLKAGRDLDGVRKVILDAVLQAQGKGCGPAVLGICIGGDRSSGYSLAKKQILRNVEDRNPDPELAALEDEMTEKSNQLGIGPMGFGGRTTVLTSKICKANRVPASFFVSIVYMCWAARQREMRFSKGEVLHD
ncbi:MAG: fumarate hydratase [Candidatus Krumholzibacteria bacterium]|jgi:fumarate hydratase class I|nr:fumarate hydratase [Candidatus Krumholzibacteria bacterium]MDP6668332.1 fumarate hydratase [Candidatus Krumholzibacteria bacterium]MDP6798091.1 fumarate hydratase [Candidatus Krumholzibacteria bacterium]MDP7022136.1 fumarate hydratase [Candidatus Krumholzibacteria bacterium]